MAELVCTKSETQSLANLAAANAGDIRLLDELAEQAEILKNGLVSRTRNTITSIVESHDLEVGEEDRPGVSIDEETNLATLTW